MQDPPQTHPADLARSPQRDLPAGHEAHRTTLNHARISDHELDAQHRAPAHIDRQTHNDPLTTTRGPAACRTAPAASAVHIPTALSRKVAEPAQWHPRTDGQDGSADSRDKLHLLPNDREARR